MNKSVNTKGCILFTIAFIILFIFLAAIIILGESYIFMYLWNWIAPLFWLSAPILTFRQAIGVVLLFDIIGGLLFRSYKS